MIGQVLCGVNNIYTVRTQADGNGNTAPAEAQAEARNGARMQCRIKGKVLKTGSRLYNPIAVGDFVEIRADPLSESMGWITGLRERSSVFRRWNNKKKAVQLLAANADLVVCIGSPQSPPFRPRFLDRLLVSARAGGLETLIVINKSDLGIPVEVKERLEAYREAGFPVLTCSARTGEGVATLRSSLQGKLSVLAGQSGVGKSSLLNRMDPALKLKVGEVSAKYDRGSHTTIMSSLVDLPERTRIIDTPGLREFEVVGVDPAELGYYYPEFAPFRDRCSFPSCRHLDEPDCAVRSAVEKGKVHPDRYESYLRLREDLEALYKEFHGSPHP